VERLLNDIPRNTLANAVNRAFLERICDKRWPDGVAEATKLRQVYGPARAIREYGSERDWCTSPSFRRPTAPKWLETRESSLRQLRM